MRGPKVRHRLDRPIVSNGAGTGRRDRRRDRARALSRFARAEADVCGSPRNPWPAPSQRPRRGDAALRRISTYVGACVRAAASCACGSVSRSRWRRCSLLADNRFPTPPSYSACDRAVQLLWRVRTETSSSPREYVLTRDGRRATRTRSLINRSLARRHGPSSAPGGETRRVAAKP